MARACRRPQNQVLNEIDQGIQDYRADAREEICRRRQSRLIEILTGADRTDGIFYRPIRPAAAADGLANRRNSGRPILWS